ncbi:MAG: type II toxin-antitoxin system VapC family toxin [Opitutales bacterium]|nr:type II toxin-antitoxin system VapC family toxin [Opitutales bacterium]
MIEATSALVDTNVIIDIVQENPAWVAWSVAVLSRHEGLWINPIVYAELCYRETSVEEVDRLLDGLGLGYREMPRDALYLASQAFRHYRSRGGRKTAPLPDFFVGAHAAALGVPIITRDGARYQSYFPTVPLILP